MIEIASRGSSVVANKNTSRFLTFFFAANIDILLALFVKPVQRRLGLLGIEHAVNRGSFVAIFDDEILIPNIGINGSLREHPAFSGELGSHVEIMQSVILGFIIVIGALRRWLGGLLAGNLCLTGIHTVLVRVPFARRLQVGKVVLRGNIDRLRGIVVFGEREVAQIVGHRHSHDSREDGEDSHDGQQLGYRETLGMLLARHLPILPRFRFCQIRKITFILPSMEVS